MERWEDRLARSALTDRQAAEQIAKLPPPCSSLVLLYSDEGPGPCPPSSPALLAVNWAPARPRPFIASICQSLQAWMVPETLYKWGASFHLYLTPSVHLFNALSIPESKQVWPRAVRGKQWLNKSRGLDITMGRWLMFSPVPPRSLSLNLALA